MIVLSMLVALIAVAPAWARVELTAVLDAAQLVPPAPAAAAAGLARFVVDDDGVRWELQVRDLTGFATVTEVRLGRPGENGALLATLTNPPPTGTHVGDFGPLDETTLQTLFAGGAYVSVATVAHPDGELRGQLMLAELPDVTCRCVGATTRAFRRCVRQRLAQRPALRRSPAGRTLRREVRRAICGSQANKPRVCCLRYVPDDNIVIERPCTSAGAAPCARRGGTRPDAGSGIAAR